MSFLAFEIVFPIIGCLIVALGVLMAILNKWACKIQRALNEMTLLGRWASDSITPEFTRISGIIIASFGALWLAFVLVILVVSTVNSSR